MKLLFDHKCASGERLAIQYRYCRVQRKAPSRLMRLGDRWERSAQEGVALRAPRQTELPDSRSFARRPLRNWAAVLIPVRC